MAVRGINIGGWLVAERWMTPGLFVGVHGDGERAIGYELGHEVAQKRIEAHRQSFITEIDFKWIATHGFEFVRVPVGYWLFRDDEGFVSGEKYVRLVFAWAEQYGLKVVLDLHGLPGSQNGRDHSGQTGKVTLYRRKNLRGALETVDYLTRMYGQEPSLLGVELINEPTLRRGRTFSLLRYYQKAYRIAVRNIRPDVKIIVSDAYEPLRLARALARKRFGAQLVLDVHLYQLFTQEDQAMDIEAHINKVMVEWRALLMKLNESITVLVGEWSAALPSKVTGGGAADDGVRAYYEAQKAVFDDAAWAHSYWSYKAPGQGAWSYHDQVDTLGDVEN